jgi:NADH dehydrogenase
LRQALEIIMRATGTGRWLVPIPAPFLRGLVVTLESFIPRFPASSFLVDYYAVHRTCPVDNLPRMFGLMPARFTYRLDYLTRKPWYSEGWHTVTTAFAKLSARIQNLLRTTR